MSGYQPAPGVWSSSPQRKLLWAVHGVLHRLEKEIPEQSHVDTWATDIERALDDPVQKFDWEAWYERNVAKARTPRWKRVAASAAGERMTRVVRDDSPEPPDDVVAAWDGVTAEITGKLWTQAGEMRAKSEGLPFNPDDLAAALETTFDEVQGITDTTRDALRRMMKFSLEEGEGQFGFARRLRSEFHAYSTAKAKQVAVTEWNRAASTATLIGYRDMGVQQKMWFTLGDNRVCEICDANAAAGPIGIDDSFWSGDDAPPAHPSCRCSVSSA